MIRVRGRWQVIWGCRLVSAIGRSNEKTRTVFILGVMVTFLALLLMLGGNGLIYRFLSYVHAFILTLSICLSLIHSSSPFPSPLPSPLPSSLPIDTSRLQLQLQTNHLHWRHLGNHQSTVGERPSRGLICIDNSKVTV